MRIGKLWLVAILSALPAVASAQVNVGVNVNIDLNAYDTTAPGDPVESVDVFYDQLQPYGVWVDEPDIGRVFIPQQEAFVPYTTGHWEYTRLGFVWVSNEPFAWATTHYGRWAYSNPYGRWVWLPDTEWGPAWVEWRQTSTDFGWAPLPPTRIAYTPPPESWHYCGANHILDVNVTRYYEPRDRVVVIHREARPIEHYQTVSNVKVVVGPPPSVLRDHRVEAKPVAVQAKVIGRWTAPEARAQVQRAQEHRQTFEIENQKRLEANTRVHAAQQKVIETHPQIKVQAEARIKAQPARPEPARPNPAQPARPEPNRVEPKRPEPNRVEPARPNPAQPARPEPNRVEPKRPEPAQPARPNPAQPARPEPNRVEPKRPEPTQPARPEPKPAQPNRVEPNRPEPVKPAQPNRPEPARPEPRPAQPHVESRPEPARPNPQPAQPRPEPARPAPQPAQHAEPARPNPQPAPHAEPAKPAPHHEPEKK